MNSSLIASNTNLEPALSVSMAMTSKVQQNSVSFPFQFSYSLLEHPLFQTPRLIELARLISSRTPDNVTCVAKGSATGDCNRSGQVYLERLAETIACAEEVDLLILIKDAQHDPEYQAFLEQILSEIERLTGHSLRRKWVDLYVFIAPAIALDRRLNCESNFLFQVHEKEVLFRKNNHSIFISLVARPGEDRTVSLNVFVPEPVTSSVGGGKVCVKRIERNRSPQPGARLGRDPRGTPAWYAPDPKRPGKYLRVANLS